MVINIDTFGLPLHVEDLLSHNRIFMIDFVQIFQDASAITNFSQKYGELIELRTVSNFWPDVS